MTLEAWRWYVSIFAWLYFTGIGIPPCPEEAGILYAAGLTALHPEVRWWLALPATIGGIVCADMTLYAVGRRWGRRLLGYRWVQRIVHPERFQRLEEKFHDNGITILMTARFLPPLRTGIFIIAGAVHYSFLRFLLADLGYAIFGVGLLFFGGTWVIELLRLAGHWAWWVVGGAVAAYALYRYYRYLQKREARRRDRPPLSVLELPAPPAIPEPPAPHPGSSSPSDRLHSPSP
jgi:membrane protein DedA with SNARE-associated domain